MWQDCCNNYTCNERKKKKEIGAANIKLTSKCGHFPTFSF